MDSLNQLQKWYYSQCNGDWEHGYGIKIDTLDNPGWSIKIDLHGTELENKAFQEHSYGMGKDAETSGDNWLICKIEDKVFKGFSGPFKLEEMIRAFLGWAQGNSEPGAPADDHPRLRAGDRS